MALAATALVALAAVSYLDTFLLTTEIPGMPSTPITVMVNFVQGLPKNGR